MARKTEIMDGHGPSNEAVGPGGVDNMEAPKTTDEVLAKDRERKRGPYKRRRVSAPEIVAPLFTPETVAPFVDLPYDLTAAYARWDGWRLDEQERAALANPAAACANAWLPGLDPRWVSILALSGALVSVTLAKLAMYRDVVRERQAEKVRRENVNASPSTGN